VWCRFGALAYKSTTSSGVVPAAIHPLQHLIPNRQPPTNTARMPKNITTTMRFLLHSRGRGWREKRSKILDLGQWSVITTTPYTTGPGGSVLKRGTRMEALRTLETLVARAMTRLWTLFSRQRWRLLIEVLPPSWENSVDTTLNSNPLNNRRNCAATSSSKASCCVIFKMRRAHSTDVARERARLS